MREKLIELLITADDYEDRVCKSYNCKTCPYNGIDCTYKARADHLIANDVVTVVRCKDCVWCEQGKSYEPYCNHPTDGMHDVQQDDFCSYGERKDI